MFLILPVQTLLLYTTVGVSTYTFVSWLLSLHPLEMMIYTSLMSAIASMGCVLIMVFLVPTSIDAILDKMEKEPLYCTHCGKSFGIQSEATYNKQHRVVVEKDGTLIITTTFAPELAEDSVEHEEGVEEESEEEHEVEQSEEEEIRECLEKSEPLPSPVEETNEFSDLLEKSLLKE